MKTTPLSLPSFAKINLFLKVLGKRRDGYHELCTAFQTISLHDELNFTEAPGLTLVCADRELASDENNLVLRAARALREHSGTERGARIALEKRIPYPGGLGGGSSNAAVTLLGLATLWELDIGTRELLGIAAALGSDVPYFLYGGTALGRGRGTVIEPVRDQPEMRLAVVTPPVPVPTAEAYRRMAAPDLTNTDPKSILKICRDDAEKLDSGRLKFTNDFEPVVFGIEPEIKAVRDRLLELDATTALLSGSGASVFAIFDNDDKRREALAVFAESVGYCGFAVETVSRAAYRKHLRPCEHLLPKDI